MASPRRPAFLFLFYKKKEKIIKKEKKLTCPQLQSIDLSKNRHNFTLRNQKSEE